ncbi:MAG: hypothetical protein GY944_05120 [bacterium]|nr:hypothetical protein [bacterium]MCP5040389.1 hypothetical protein [bacterium]
MGRVPDAVSGIMRDDPESTLHAQRVHADCQSTGRFMDVESIDGLRGFEPDYAGKVAECDGGGPIQGTRYSGRQDFRGRLTGDCVDVGDPPSRWYLMVDLEVRPEGFQGEAVWCLAGNTFLGEDGPSLRNGPDT